MVANLRHLHTHIKNGRNLLQLIFKNNLNWKVFIAIFSKTFKFGLNMRSKKMIPNDSGFVSLFGTGIKPNQVVLFVPATNIV